MRFALSFFRERLVAYAASCFVSVLLALGAVLFSYEFGMVGLACVYRFVVDMPEQSEESLEHGAAIWAREAKKWFFLLRLAGF